MGTSEMMTKKFLSLFMILGLSILCPLAIAATLTPLTYLTFEKEDTSNHIVVNFITEGVSPATTVYYDTIDHGSNKTKYRYKINSRVDTISNVDRAYHHASLENLKPNTTYFFIFGDSSLGTSKRYKFKTLPSDDSQIRLLVGGDMSASEKVVENAQDSMKIKPHLIIIGGDVAYANGRVRNEIRWVQWFEKMNRVMLGTDGHLTPLVLAIGNHETTLGIANSFNRAPFFFKLFPQNGERSFFKRKLGSLTGLIILDSGHMVRHSEQTDFLEKALKSFSTLEHQLAAYHAPLYPNHRNYSDKLAARGRKHWQPLFDKYNLDLSFEHHDHTLKRTKVIRADKVAKKGTLYIGDGCWGKDARKSNQKWYLEKGSSTTHVWQAFINKKSIILKAVGKDTEVYDHLTLEQKPNETIVKELPIN